MTKEDTCPTSMTGEHKYFVFKTVEVFEPTEIDQTENEIYTQLYAKNEYAILGCNCGSVIKTEVKTK